MTKILTPEQEKAILAMRFDQRHAIRYIAEKLKIGVTRIKRVIHKKEAHPQKTYSDYKRQSS